MPERRGRRDTSRKHQAILEAARVCFIEEGYDGVSMDRIAERAGASKRTVYNHFPSKEDLFHAVLGELGDQARALQQVPYDPRRSLESQLQEFADARLRTLRDPGWVGMVRVTLGTFGRDPKLAREILQKSSDPEDSLIGWLRAAHADRRLRVPNPEMAAGIFWSMISGAFWWRAVFNDPVKPKDVPPLKKELIQTFLARYARES